MDKQFIDVTLCCEYSTERHCVGGRTPCRFPPKLLLCMKMNRNLLSQTLTLQCSEIAVKIHVLMMDRGEIGSGNVHRSNMGWGGGATGDKWPYGIFSTRE